MGGKVLEYEAKTILNKGREEGRAEEIISMGLESNFSENSILEILQNRLDITLQKATEYFKRFAGQVHT